MEITQDKLQKSYLDIHFAFMKYEEIAVDFFSNEDHDKRILTHFKNGDIETKVKETYGKD